MKYHVVEDSGFVLIRISGKPKKNEALAAKRILFPYFKERGVRVIMDLKKLERFDPITLLGVLSGIKKEITLLRGDLKLCSLNPDMLNYFQENRLDNLFQIEKDEENAKKAAWRNDGTR
jgi:anti-anti-sigma factor